MKTKLLALFLSLTLFLSGCSVNIIRDDGTAHTPDTEQEEHQPADSHKPGQEQQGQGGSSSAENTPTKEDSSAKDEPEQPGQVADLGDDHTTFGEDIAQSGAYDGYFEGASTDITIECLSGTKDAYRLDGTTLTFTAISADSAYSIRGTFRGNIVIDAGDGYKFELELQGLSLVCNATTPISIQSGDEVTIKAKKDTHNYIYDTRAVIDSTDETQHAGAIHAEVDLKISGKGELFVISENNNGIHSKDDLQLKNLTLFVACVDNALKGNDSVEIENATTTLIATAGDCIKTSNSDISQKHNQRGDVTITSGTHTLYAACDGIDAAHNVVIDNSATVLNIYTDKYSNYSQKITDSSADTDYIRATSDTRGIKAANEISVHAGTLRIKSHGNAIHAGSDNVLENGAMPVGNITIDGGTIAIYTNDNGLYASGTLDVKAGNVTILHADKCFEAPTQRIEDGIISDSRAE